MSFKFEIDQPVLVSTNMAATYVCRVTARTEHADYNSYNLSVKYDVSLKRGTISSTSTSRSGVAECLLSSSPQLNEAMGRLAALQERVEGTLDDMAEIVLQEWAKEEADE